MSDSKDTLYRDAKGNTKPFEFDENVVAVFPDMIKRSVPGYPLTIAMMGVIADKYFQPGSNVYDLGCSLGAVSFAVQQSVRDENCHIIAVDNSEAMIQTCLEAIPVQQDKQTIEFRCENIQDTKIENASIIIMNFTLQFIPLTQRQAVLERIYASLLPGGVLVLSEKLNFNSTFENDMMITLHHHMKGLNGYDELEIAGKRDALEAVLLPESIETHQTRLKQAGFANTLVWLRCFNFASILAFK